MGLLQSTIFSGCCLRRSTAARDRHADVVDGGRGDRQGRRLDRADPDDPGTGHAADQAVRSEELKQRFLPRCARGVVAGVCAVGARGGLRPGGMITGADQDGDEWVINGGRTGSPTPGSPTSTWCSRRPTARPATRAGSPPSSSRPTPRVQVGRIEPKIGIRARRPASLFDGVPCRPRT